MTLVQFAITVAIVSISGVMSPGPLFAANLSYGIKGGMKSGLKMAMGHTMVELPLVVLLGLGIVSLGTLPQFREISSILGAISLFVFAGLQIKSVLRKTFSTFIPRRGPILAGALLTGLNPFFIAWWFTIGSKLISDGIILYSLLGIFVMFAFHIWMDYLWMGTVGVLSSKGRNIISEKYYRIFMVGTSAALIYFGISFLEQIKF